MHSTFPKLLSNQFSPSSLHHASSFIFSTQDNNGATNLDRPVDVAVLHHYKYRSPQEFYSKACEGEMKGSPECRKKNKPYAGTVKDDSAWEAMKKNVPRYAMFDEFEDFM